MASRKRSPKKRATPIATQTRVRAAKKAPTFLAIHARALAERTRLMPKQVHHKTGGTIPLPHGYRVRTKLEYRTSQGSRFAFILYRGNTKVGVFTNYMNAAAYARAEKATRKVAIATGRAAGRGAGSLIRRIRHKNP